MAKTYYTVLTTYGSQLFAQAMANRQPVRITQFAVGDGNGRAVQPDSARTSLVRQVHRANISAVSPDPRNNKQVIFELTIPENIGGFWIREMGIYDANNRLVAYANCPDTYKPQLSEGSGKVQVMRMILLVSSSQAVTLTVDDTVIFATRGQLTPKTITATSQNGVDDTGHSHAIDHATTGQKGIVQLTNDTGLDSEALALTAKAGKRLAQEIAKNHQLASSKYTAQDASTSQKGLVQLVDNLTSSNNDKALTAKQGKTLNDKIKFIYNIVKSNNIPVNLDLTSRDQIIAEMGNNYQGIGVYRFTFHNLTGHNITGLPLGDTAGAVAIELEVMGGFSRMSCQYLYANRQFITHVDWNKPTLTLRWYEVLSLNNEGKVPRPINVNGSIDTNHRVMVRRNSRTASPYLLLLDDGVDLAGEISARKLIGGIQFHAGKQGTEEGMLKAIIRSHILTDKNTEMEFSGKDANDAWRRFLTMLTATGNVIVGHNADNGRDRLQINGTVRATAPAANANNDQLPTTAWVNSALDKVRTVSRRDYSRRINGTAAGQTNNQMDVVGSVHIHPDGRIVQILHLKHFRDLWFEPEDISVGYGDGSRGMQINLQLWTAMPNKILSVQPQLVRSTHPTSSVVYWSEASEIACAWDLRKQGNSRDRVIIDMSRFKGSASEHMDMYVVVEGY